MRIVTPGLVGRILDGYMLPVQGYHGLTHWARVLENGRRLADLCKADAGLVGLFAVFHDSRRINEAVDRGHGRRGAQLAREFQGTWFELDDERFSRLEAACEGHTCGRTTADISIQVCWDADRLDLLRVGISPRPEFLCTKAAREHEIMRWANVRAAARFIPGLIREDWGFDLDTRDI